MDSDFLKWTWRTFIWARGFVAAVSLVAILDSAFGWDRVEFLKFTHALVTHWDHLLLDLLSPLLAIFAVPQPSRDLLSLTVLLLVVLPIPIIWAIRDGKKALQDRDWKEILINAWMLVPSAGLVPLIVFLWMRRPQIFFDETARWFIPLSFLLPVFWVSLRGRSFMDEGTIEFQMARSVVTGFMFILSLELLHFIPQVRGLAAEFVLSAERLEAEPMLDR